MNPQRDRVEPPPAPFRLDKRRVRTTFERAAAGYDSAARVQRELALRLLEHLKPVRIEPGLVVDVGAGTGDLARELDKLYRRARVVALDFAAGMLVAARSKARRFFSRQRFVCGDAEALPLKDASVDLVVSNATLQWCDEPERAFAEALRVLKPGGLLMFSTFGPDTLRELKECFASIDAQPHVHGFIDMHDLGDALVRTGFADVVMDAVRLTAEYDDVFALMRELKTIGATNALVARTRGLTGRARLEKLARAYEGFRRNGVLPATFEAVFAHGFKPHPRGGVAVTLAPRPGR